MLFSGWEDKPQHSQTRKFKEIFIGLPFHSRVFINTLQMQAWKTSSLLWGAGGWNDRRCVGPQIIHHPKGTGEDQIRSQR